MTDQPLDPGANWCPDCGLPRGVCDCEFCPNCGSLLSFYYAVRFIECTNRACGLSGNSLGEINSKHMLMEAARKAVSVPEDQWGEELSSAHSATEEHWHFRKPKGTNR
jgi:hypothetical protein